MIGYISADGTTSTMFHPLARDASRPGSPLANATFVSWQCFIPPACTSGSRHSIICSNRTKRKKGKRPGAAGECWITQLSDWCANTSRWFDSQPRYLLLTVPLWGIQFTTTTTTICTTSHFLMTPSSLRVIIRGGLIRVFLYCERWS